MQPQLLQNQLFAFQFDGSRFGLHLARRLHAYLFRRPIEVDAQTLLPASPKASEWRCTMLLISRCAPRRSQIGVIVLTMAAIGAAYSPFKLEAQNSRSTPVDAGPRARTPDPPPSAAQGHIGIELSDVPSTQAGNAHGAGALVRRVQLGSPAAQAGVRVNDVITALNGTPIARANDVKAAMAHLAPGSTAELQILREGQPLTVTVNVVAAGPSGYSGAVLSTARATSQNSELSSDMNDSSAELLVAGKPPLTGELVNKGIRLFEWLLDAHLTIEQRSLLRNCLVGIWNTHRQADIDDAAKALNFQDQVSSKSPEERAVIREALSEKFVASARQKPSDVFAQWMLNI